MNKKEVLEIRKQFTPERCVITRISGCYVTHEKEKRLDFTQAFLALPEEECFKYFDIFKKAMSGTMGKNLFSLEFPLAAEAAGGTQEFLLRLRDSKLEDAALLDEFYDKVIENFEYPENYYIILIHGAYDVPGKASDGLEMFDASDTVYSHILCCICPVNLSKAGLSYNATANTFEERLRDWVVEMPMNSFLFPAFTDRDSDLHAALYYSKKADDLRNDFIDNVLGCQLPLTANDQKYSFAAVVSDTLEDTINFETVKTIHENLNEMIEETKDSPDPLVLSKPDVKRLLERSGVAEEQLENFDTDFNEVVGEDQELLAANITNTKTFELKTPEITVKVDPQRLDLVEIREIDGRKFLVIPVENDLVVNGLDITK